MITAFPQDWGNRLLEDTKFLLGTRTQEKGAVAPQETESDFPVSVHEPRAEVWVYSALPGSQGY